MAVVKSCRQCDAPLVVKDPMNPELLVNMDTKARDGLCHRCKKQRNRRSQNKGKKF